MMSFSLLKKSKLLSLVCVVFLGNQAQVAYCGKHTNELLNTAIRDGKVKQKTDGSRVIETRQITKDGHIYEDKMHLGADDKIKSVRRLKLSPDGRVSKSLRIATENGKSLVHKEITDPSGAKIYKTYEK